MNNKERGEFLIEQSILISLKDLFSEFFTTHNLDYSTVEEALNFFISRYTKADLQLTSKYDGMFPYTLEPLTLVVQKGKFKFQFAIKKTEVDACIYYFGEQIKEETDLKVIFGRKKRFLS